MTDPPTVSAFQPSDNQIGDRGIPSSQDPFTAADHLKFAFTPWTVGFLPAPYIKNQSYPCVLIGNVL